MSRRRRVHTHLAMPGAPARAACRGSRVNQLSFFDPTPMPTEIASDVTCRACKRTPEWIAARAAELLAEKAET